MKLELKCIIFLLALFLFNIILYFISENYRLFLEDLKYSEQNKQDIFIDEDIHTNKNENNTEIKEGNNILSNDSDFLDTIKYNYEKNVQKQIVLGKKYRELLEMFENYYDLNKIQVNSQLFDITDEYPDYYYEYYSPLCSLYLFPSKTFDEIFDIFDYLEGELPFSLNKVDNFGEQSFYINMQSDIEDDFVRIVINRKGINFGLKIKKDEYNKVKLILKKK